MKAGASCGTPAPAFERHRGRVVDFDTHRGLGTLSPTDGPEGQVGFHCTAITDGSRSIEPGTDVEFVIGPAGPGRWEAVSVDPLAPSSPRVEGAS